MANRETKYMATAAPTLHEARAALRRMLPSLRREYRIGSLGIFGSYIRGEQRADSDLDLLVTFEETPSLLKLIELENRLLKPAIGERILAEVQPL
jgi:uncharacterized protein